MGRGAGLRRGGALAYAGAKLLTSMASQYFGVTTPNGAYQGASSTRQAMQAWRTSNASPDVDVLSNLPILRSRSRDLIRNVPTASAAIKKKTINVVSTGLKYKPRLNAERLGITREQARQKEKEIAYVFHRWAKSKHSDAARTNNFYQNTALVYQSMLSSGDVFSLLPFINRPTSYLDVAVKVVESDLCRDPHFNLPTRELVGGIEQDEWGAPVAYWFAKHHIQDVNIEDSIENMIRVPAYGEETGREMVLHVFGLDRPGQRRGVPLLAAVIEPLKQLGRYRDAELMAAVVAGMFTVFVKTLTGAPSSQGNVPDSAKVGNAPSVADKDPGDYEMSYGGIVDLGQDEEIQTANPGRPNPNFDPFTHSILKEAGGHLGIGVEMIQGYYASSYTAARAAFLDAFAGFKVEFANLKADFCEPVKNTVMMNAVLRGKLDLPGYLDDPEIREMWEDGDWVGVAPGQLDPLKETMAYALKVKEQLKSRRTAAQESDGEDYEEVVEELAEEKAWREERGIPLEKEIEAGAVADGMPQADDQDPESGSEEDEMQGEELTPLQGEELEDAAKTADTFGVLTRAGAATPQKSDEGFFRKLFRLPTASKEVEELWDSSGGYRRPITLAKEEAQTAEKVDENEVSEEGADVSTSSPVPGQETNGGSTDD